MSSLRKQGSINNHSYRSRIKYGMTEEFMHLEDIKKLREETGAGIADINKVIKTARELVKTEDKGYSEEVIKLAREMLKKEGFEKAARKGDRAVKAGMIEVYSHGGKVGVIVELLCETDFVGKTEDFKNLAHELVLQIASMNPSSLEELLKQEYIRDNSQTIDQLIKTVAAKLGENIVVGRFARIALGKS